MPRSPESARAAARAWNVANRDRYNAAARERRRSPLPPSKDEAARTDCRFPPEHGTVTMYRRHGCRCERCRMANSDEVALNRARRKARDEGRVLDEEAWWQERMNLK